MTHDQILELSDDALIAQADRVAGAARAGTVELIQLLIEVERRRVHLALGHSSLFVFCTRRLRLSEAAAYGRITAARTARRFPIVLDMLADGSLTLSGLSRLAAHLTDDNAAQLLESVRLKSTREVEQIVASIEAKPNVPPNPRSNVRPSIRALPVRRSRDEQTTESDLFAQVAAEEPEQLRERASIAAPRESVADAPDRYLLKVAIRRETQQKLEQLRALLRHQIPDGDIAEILDRALALLLDRTVLARFAETRRRSMRRTDGAASGNSQRDDSSRSGSRYIPAAVRRAVWRRDQGRCAFVGADGRCGETGFVEIHHIQPFAMGGASTVDNLELRCRAHNAYEAALIFGGPAGARAAERARHGNTGALRPRGAGPAVAGGL